MKQTITHIFIALLLLTTFTACGLQPRIVKVIPNQKSAQPTEPKEKSAEQFEQKVNLLLEQQSYAKAISYTTNQYSKNQTERLASFLVKAINSGLNQSEFLMQSGDFESAALLLKAITDGYPSETALQKQLTKSSLQIDKDFNLCTQKMMDDGLTAYRAGDFSTAIETWEKIIAADPHHIAAQNSLQTTRIQLSRLKDLNGKN